METHHTDKAIKYGLEMDNTCERAVNEGDHLRGEELTKEHINVDDNDSINVHSDDNCNLIINYLPQDIQDAYLRDLFEEFGEIESAKVVRERGSKKCLGYGFVKYKKEADAQHAVSMRNGYEIGRKRLKVSFARPSSEKIKNCKLYITNLPRNYSQNDVTKLFSRFGEIIECRVLRDQDNSGNKGVAFVQFAEKREAEAALSLNGERPSGSDRPMVVKYAEGQQKKRERRRTQSNVGPNHISPKAGGGVIEIGPRYRDFGVQNVPSQMGMNINDVRHINANLLGSPNRGISVGSRGMRGGKQGRGMSMEQIPIHGMFGGIQMGMGKTNIPYNSQQMAEQQWYDMQTYSGYDVRGEVMAYSYPMNESIDLIRHGTVFLSQPVGHGHTGHSSTASVKGANSAVTMTIQSLPENADVQLLHDLFAPYGRIHTAQIDTHGPSGCMGKGTVIIEGVLRAQHALHALDGYALFEGSQPLSVHISSIQ